MIYFDNAATSFPKPRCVIKEVNSCLKKYCGNAGRGSNSISIRASEAIYSVREKVAELLGVDTPESIVFTYNATYALNFAIKSLIKENCHVLTSDYEHNSVIRPLEKLRNSIGISYSSFSSDGDIRASILKNITPHTAAIVCSLASNVTGQTINLQILSDIAKEKGLILIIDASQAAGHIQIDLSKTPCDALCAPGHKALLGIQGGGFVYFKDKKRKETLIEGGSGAQSVSPMMPMLLPEGYEAGTLSTPAIAALGSGIDYISSVGIENISKKLDKLTTLTCERLSKIKNVKIYGSGSGIVSFNMGDRSSTYLASALDKAGICSRAGLHCAPTIHRKLGTLNQGAVRVSFSYFNTERELDKLYHTLKNI